MTGLCRKFVTLLFCAAGAFLAVEWGSWGHLERTGDENPRFIISVGGKYGYIDRSGKVVIPPQFDEADEFSEGLAAVRVKDKYGYIDVNGKWVVKPKFSIAFNFSEGMALVETEDTVMAGYIDRQGRWVIKPRLVMSRTMQELKYEYYGASSFSEGLAVVVDSDYEQTYGYIDHRGKVVIPIRFRDAQPFREGLAAVSEKWPTWGYIDHSGKMVIEPQFNEAYPFSAGLAAVRVGAIVEPRKPLKGGKWGFINKSGEWVIRPMYEEVITVVEAGSPIAVKVNGKWGFVDDRGNIVIPPQFKGTSGFSEGLAAVIEENWEYSYIDREGNKVISGPFTGASPFKNGLAEVRTADRFGYIDRAGNWVWSIRRSYRSAD